MIKKKVLLLIAACCAVFCIQAKTIKSINTLRKVFYYKGSGDTEKEMTLDLGKVVFIFSKKPIMNLLPSKKKSIMHKNMNLFPSQEKITMHKKLLFFFPRASVGNAEAEKMVKAFNSMHNKHYVLHLQQVKRPIPGLAFSITFDSNKVSFDHTHFDTIKSEKGIVFTFHNQHLLNLLSKKQKGFVRVAAVKKKEQLLSTVDTVVKIPGLSVVLV